MHCLYYKYVHFVYMFIYTHTVQIPISTTIGLCDERITLLLNIIPEKKNEQKKWNHQFEKWNLNFKIWKFNFPLFFFNLHTADHMRTVIQMYPNLCHWFYHCVAAGCIVVRYTLLPLCKPAPCNNIAGCRAIVVFLKGLS